MVAPTCNTSTLGGQSGKNAWAHVLETSLCNKGRSHLYKKFKNYAGMTVWACSPKLLRRVWQEECLSPGVPGSREPTAIALQPGKEWDPVSTNKRQTFLHQWFGYAEIHSIQERLVKELIIFTSFQANELVLALRPLDRRLMVSWQLPCFW